VANPQVVKVLGTKQAISVLKQFEPDFANELQRELRDIGKEVQLRAQSFVPSSTPLSGWGPGGRTGWRSADVRAGIGVRLFPQRKRGSTSQGIVGITSANPAAVIYERAGVRKYVKGRRGEAFVSAIEQAGGRSRMRIVGRAVNVEGSKNEAKIRDIVRRATSDLEDALNSAGRSQV
jgi:hypothetical protein